MSSLQNLAMLTGLGGGFGGSMEVHMLHKRRKMKHCTTAQGLTLEHA
jgi:hypothetical protein